MKTTSWMKRLGRAVRGFMCLWLVALCLAGAPVSSVQAQGWPVYDATNHQIDNSKRAEDLAGFSRSLQLLGTMLNVLQSILTAMDTLFNQLFGAISTVLQSLLGGTILKSQIKANVTDAMIAADTNDAMLGVQMDYVMEHAPPKNAHLCRQILIHQLAETTHDYEQAVSRVALKAIESMYRGLDPATGQPMNGDGPMYFKDDMERRCYYRYGNNIDGYPPECTDPNTRVGPYQRTFVDADLSPFTMDGSMVLELPTMETFTQTIAGQTVTMTRASATQRPEQRMWLAALNYCFQMAGPRPSPPIGRDALTESGSRAWEAFRRGLAKQSAFSKKCTDLIAHHTRPDPASTTLIAEQNRMCSAVVGKSGTTNLFDEQTIATQFGGCQVGLSPFQAKYLEQAECKSPQYYMLSAHSGVLDRESMKAAVACGVSWNQWKLNEVERQASLIPAAEGQMRVRKIWREISDIRANPQAKPKGQKLGMNESGEDVIVPKLTKGVPMTVMAPTLWSQPVSYKKTDSNGGVPSGVPFYLDEIATSEVVAQ